MRNAGPRRPHSSNASAGVSCRNVSPRKNSGCRARQTSISTTPAASRPMPMTKTLLRQAADMTWDQAIAMEEFAEPMCFTTTGHREAVAELLRS